jgi:sugar fermentation stimulation protein A
MRLPSELLPATFVARRNRFAAEVALDGHTDVVHVPNSGRMSELLVPGCGVLLYPAPQPSVRCTAYDLILVRYRGRWVGIDSRMPPSLVVQAWHHGLIPMLNSYQNVRREVRLGGSRVDLLFEGPGGLCYVEAKSVNLVKDGVALFPDAPTERGSRHLGELASTVAQGHAAAVVFVIQRDDAQELAPHEEADPAFSEALRGAVSRGVHAYAIACTVTRGRITPVRSVPVRLNGKAKA